MVCALGLIGRLPWRFRAKSIRCQLGIMIPRHSRRTPILRQEVLRYDRRHSPDLRRQWRLPLSGCLIGLLAGALYIIYAPPPYKSTARILIDKSVTRFFQANKILDEPAFDDGETGSQIYVLSSESILLPVVRSMDLAHDPEFVGKVRDRDTQSLWDIGNLKKIVKQSIGWETEPPVEREEALERTALENLLKRLSVYREDAPGVITVSFASKDLKSQLV